MPTKKQSNKGRAVLPKSTKEFIPAGNRKIPVYALPAKTIIDPKKYVVVADGGQSGSRELRVLRVADLATKTLTDERLSSLSSFGNTLIDTFSPKYGYDPSPTISRFAFVESEVWRTRWRSGWLMLVDESYTSSSIPGIPFLSFIVNGDGLNLALFVLTVHLGLTISLPSIPTCNLTVMVGAQKINWNVSDLSNRSFDVVVRLGPGQRIVDFKFELGKQEMNDGSRGLIHIEKFEMFQTIFADPTETLEI